MPRQLGIELRGAAAATSAPEDYALGQLSGPMVHRMRPNLHCLAENDIVGTGLSDALLQRQAGAPSWALCDLSWHTPRGSNRNASPSSLVCLELAHGIGPARRESKARVADTICSCCCSLLISAALSPGCAPYQPN
jgi:hypothetical protein